MLYGAAYAGGNWTRTDIAMQATSSALIAADWLQTREIATNGDYAENNVLLGDHPSLGQVDAYFAGAMLGQFLVAHALPSKYRKWWLASTIAVEAYCVGNNWGLGIGFHF